MKISFLLVSVDNLAGTEQATITQANALADRHDVEIISTLRLSPEARRGVDPRVRVSYLASAGRASGHDAIYAIEDAEPLAKSPSTLVPSWWDPTLNALCDVALTRYLPTLRADVVVTMTTGMLAAAAQLIPDSTAHVHQEHRSSQHRVAGLEPLLAFGPRADAIVSLTEVDAAWLGRQFGDRAPAIHAVPNAAPAPGQPRSLLDQPLIVAAGRLDAAKQFHQLVHAFALIADEIPEWRLRIFGTGNQRWRLLNSARRAGLFDRVELPGATFDLAAEWASASISALTSSREAFPLVILEAMAAGVPVVSYDCGTGPAEVIEHGVNGYLVPEGDEETLASRLLELARDADLRRRQGTAALASLDRFDADTIRERWEHIYADAVAARRGRRGSGLATGVRRDREGDRSGAIDVPETPLITPAGARRGLVQQVADALADLPDHFVLPADGDFPVTFVVPVDAVESTLERVEKADLPDHVSLAVTAEDHWLPRRGPVPEAIRGLRNAMVKGFRLEPWPEREQRVTHLAERAGVAVEFWARDRTGRLTAPRRNPYARTVAPADLTDTTIEGVGVPGVSAFTGPLVTRCHFPIDVVYTWVDGDDPEWRAAKAAVAGEGADAADGQEDRASSGDARFRNRDELRYSLRSVEAFAPWARRIFIVTAGQRPGWLVDHPRVQLVDHREILPEEVLPTFNSHAIESALHRIPGLSRHFLYFNDDMFLGRPVDPEQFFSPGGDIAVFPSAETVGTPSGPDLPYLQAARNNRALLEQRFGATTTTTLLHTPYALRTDLMERVAEEFPDAVSGTAAARFRSGTDVSMASSLVQHYALASGEAFHGELASTFVNTTSPLVRQKLSRLTDRTEHSFCLGDHHDYALPVKKVEAMLGEFLNAYFPVPGPWERER